MYNEQIPGRISSGLAKQDINNFILDIYEDCEEIGLSWSKAVLDPAPLMHIKRKLNTYAVQRRTDILAWYDAAGGIYCRRLVRIVPTMDAICKYETYQDDLMGFIKMMLSGTNTCDKEVSAKRVQDAIQVDKKYRTEVFPEPQHLPMSIAIENLDSFIALSTLIDKIFDNFIYLKEEMEENEIPSHLHILVELYQMSTLAFLKDAFAALENTCNDFKRATSGELQPKTRPEKYVLF